jgi:DNA-binding MarR family transcriptional regulator
MPKIVALSTRWLLRSGVETGMDEDRMSAWMTLLQAHAAVVAALGEKLERERGLPLSWHEVLVHLAAAAEGKLRMQDLARSVLLSKSGVTRLVDRMEQAGMVERSACTSDRRVIYAGITDLGRSKLRDALPVFMEGFEEHFARFLSEGDARDLRASLRKVLAGHGYEEAPICPSAYVEGVPAPTG